MANFWILPTHPLDIYKHLGDVEKMSKTTFCVYEGKNAHCDGTALGSQNAIERVEKCHNGQKIVLLNKKYLP